MGVGRRSKPSTLTLDCGAEQVREIERFATGKMVWVRFPGLLDTAGLHGGAGLCPATT